MRKRYKIVLNLDIDDPDEAFPAGGDYTHLSRLQGMIHGIVTSFWGIGHTKTAVTLDKIVEKGEISEKDVKLTQDAELIRKERVFYCPDDDTEFSAVGYANPVFYADTVANCPKCGGKCWEKTENCQPLENILHRERHSRTLLNLNRKRGESNE